MSSDGFNLFDSLRRTQARMVREQRLLSGQAWLLVAALAQLAICIPPAAQYVETLLLGLGDHADRLIWLRWVFTGRLVIGLMLLALWRWAKYAPYRAAFVALAVYTGVHAAIALMYPQDVLDNISSKVIVLLGLVLAVHTGSRRRHAQ